MDRRPPPSPEEPRAKRVGGILRSTAEIDALVEDLVMDLLVSADRDLKFNRRTELDEPFFAVFGRDLAEFEGEEDFAVATFVGGVKDGALLEVGVPGGGIAEVVIEDDALIQNGLGDTDRRPEANGLGPEARMLGGAVIGECIIDLALVDEEGVFAFTVGFGDCRGFAAVEEDAAAEAFGRAAAGFPLFAGLWVDGDPASEGFGEASVRVFSGLGVAQKQAFKFGILCEVVSGLEDGFAGALGFIYNQQDAGVVVADEVMECFLDGSVLDSEAEYAVLFIAGSESDHVLAVECLADGQVWSWTDSGM